MKFGQFAATQEILDAEHRRGFWPLWYCGFMSSSLNVVSERNPP